MEKKQWLAGICLIFGLLVVNLFLPKWNRGTTYLATDLPSEFCVEHDPRVVEHAEKTGCLTFGPYLEQEAGNIQVTVVYETNVEGNWVDIYSDLLKETFQKANLDPEKKEITLEAEIGTKVTDLEIRSHYEGNGYLRVEKIIVVERVKELRMVILIYDLIFLGGLVGGCYWKIYKKKGYIKKEKYRNLFTLVMIIIVVVLLNYPLINNETISVMGDGLGYYNLKSFLSNGIKSGELPIWNPYTSIGTPFLADIQSSFFDPFNILYLIFPVTFAYNLYHIIQLIIAAFFMYLLILEMTEQYAASVLVGFLFSFSVMMSRLEHSTIVAAITYFPMLVFCCEKFRKTNKIKWIVILAVCMSVQFFSGFTQIVLYFDILLFAYMIYCLYDNHYTIKKGIMILVKWIGLYFLLISVQLLPLVQLILQSGRGDISWDYFSSLAYDFRILLMMFSPNIYKSNMQPFGTFSSEADIEIYISVICMPYLIYEIIYCLKERRVKVLLGILSIAFFYGMAPHIPLLGKIIYHIPVLNSFRVCGRILALFVFTCLILVGLCFAQISDKIVSRRVFNICSILTAGIAVSSFAVISILSQDIFQLNSDYYNAVLDNIKITIFLSLFNFVCLYFISKTKQAISRQAILMVIGIFAIADVSRFSLQYIDKQYYVDQLLEEGITEDVKKLIDETTENNYRSFAAIKSVDNYYSSDLLNIAKAQRAVEKRKKMYNSYLSFLDKKLDYWQVKETEIYSKIFQQIKANNGFISMLGIRYIFDAWNNGINLGILDWEQKGEEKYYKDQINMQGNSQVLTYDIAAEWIEGNTSYRISFETEKELPAICYVDLFSKGYDFSKQEAIFYSMDGKKYQTVITTEELPDFSSELPVFFRIVAFIENEYTFRECFIEKIETLDLYPELPVLDNTIKVYENKSAKPIIYVPEEVVSIGGYGNTWMEDGITKADRVNYIVDFGKDMDLRNVNTEVKEIDIQRNCVSAMVRADNETFINHSQLAYPGWCAYVDGKEVELFVVNNLIQGIIVPSGEHRVEFRFKPMDVKIGAILSMAGLFICIIWIKMEYRPRVKEEQNG